MAEHHSGPAEVGASMDYAEHDKTYRGFLFGAKYGSMIIAVLLICMAVGFFSGAGAIFSTLLFMVLTALGFYLL